MVCFLGLGAAFKQAIIWPKAVLAVWIVCRRSGFSSRKVHQWCCKHETAWVSASCGIHMNRTHGIDIPWSLCFGCRCGGEKNGAQVTANGLQSENSSQSSFQYHFVLTFLSQFFSPCSLGSAYKRQICVTLCNKKYISNYIANSVGYLLWKSFTWPAFPSFPELYPIPALPKFLLYFLCICRIQSLCLSLCLSRPWKSCSSEAFISLLLRIAGMFCPMLVNC